VAEHWCGPFEVRKSQTYRAEIIGRIGPKNEPLVLARVVTPPVGGRSQVEDRQRMADANARLFAASPDLLTAVEALLDDEFARIQTASPRELARAAINKVEGCEAISLERLAQLASSTEKRERHLLTLISRLLPFAEARADQLSEQDVSSEATRQAQGAVEDAQCALADAGMDEATLKEHAEVPR
jgi:HPt (histidine-containing phosphotransfer) domain-containing protein